MGFPTIEFNGTVGSKSTGLGGPDQIESDLLELKKMFDPGTTLKSTAQGGISAANMQTGALDGRYYTETEVDALCATKAELAALVIGTFGTGFVTDDMLSNTAGQVKPDVATLQTDVSKIDMYAVTTNAGNVYSATLTAAPTVGKPFYLKFNADSTDAVSLNINGAGAKAVKKGTGSNFTNAKNESIYGFIDNGTNFILQGSDSSGDATAADLLAGKTCTTDAGEVTGTMPDRSGETAATGYSMSGTTIKLLASEGYRDGANDYVTKDLTAVDADFTEANIRRNKDVLGISNGTAYGVGDTILYSSLSLPTIGLINRDYFSTSNTQYFVKPFNSSFWYRHDYNSETFYKYDYDGVALTNFLITTSLQGFRYDGSGNIYSVTAWDSGLGRATLAKYTSSGSVVWSGKVIQLPITGVFSGWSVCPDGSTIYIYATSNLAMYVARIDSDGVLIESINTTIGSGSWNNIAQNHMNDGSFVLSYTDGSGWGYAKHYTSAFAVRKQIESRAYALTCAVGWIDADNFSCNANSLRIYSITSTQNETAVYSKGTFISNGATNKFYTSKTINGVSNFVEFNVSTGVDNDATAIPYDFSANHLVFIKSATEILAIINTSKCFRYVKNLPILS